MSSTEEDSGAPILPSESPGSSVSDGIMDEYQELLKYAVVTPHFDPDKLPKTIAEAMNAFQKTDDAALYVEENSESSSENSSTSTVVESDHSSKEPSLSAYPEQNWRTTPHGRPSTFGYKELKQTADNWYSSPQVPQWAVPNGNQDLSTEEGSVSTPGSTDSNSPASTLRTPSVDADLARMEAELDGWSLGLKRQVLAELSQAKLKLLHKHRQAIQAEKNRHSQEVNQLQDEIARLQELLHTYQQSTERKDGVITNLTNAMQKQKQRFEMLKKFNWWKLRHSEDRREVFTGSLARKHHQRQLMQKVFAGWRGIIEAKWKQRVEKACQSKAQEVCMTLTNDYEARIASVNEALESSRQEVAKLHAEREHYEEAMKKAFMRGVCALNMEAMSMFHQSDEDGDTQQQMAPMQAMQSMMQPAREQETSHVQAASHRARRQEVDPTAHRGTHHYPSSTTRVGKSFTSKTGSKPRVVVAKVTGKDTGIRAGIGLAPAKASVVVERHTPISQQTIGHAQASRHPARSSTVPSRT
ncbi:centrosomal protein POC5-like [Anneissia japonica]|uniref:centrosomal protein POC5-like n=1 Tax=Anneissia japonica TaxID=1529436 RepID=UPI001425AE3E|nr:centrosomal protein POC5-like [Anneissia japonica]